MMKLRPLLEPAIGLKHGAGGRAMRTLIESVFVDGFAGMTVDGFGLEAMDDGAAIRLGDQWLVMTTDSHVIHPIFFPGGDIGRLSICGTVNDLAMMGSTEPMGLTCGVIIEAGFQRDDLIRIQRSMREACEEAGAIVVTGDTKVMGHGELDGIVINTAGVGITKTLIRDNGLKPGDRIIVTGNIGDHGFAVLAKRHDLKLEGDLKSDVAPINGLVRSVIALGDVISAMKDPTRGGLASALHEMAQKSGVGVVLEENAVPMTREVRAASEIVGIDPLHMANEGKAVMGVRPESADAVLAALRAHPLGRNAAVVGLCVAERPGSVILDTGVGRRLLQEPEGDPMPRIC